MTVFLAALSLAACDQPEAAETALASGLFVGEGRNALCITDSEAPQRAGFIVYGEGDRNCSARGRVEPRGITWDLIPDGDATCRIPFSVNDGRIALGPAHPSCTYYCAPGAAFAGTSFGRVQPSDAGAASRAPMTDFGGDPLC